MVETPYKSLYDITTVTIEKEEFCLDKLKGEFSLVVNTSSKSNEFE
jgi:glutathione peroxidase-family protein